MRTSVVPSRAARLKPLLVVAGVFTLGAVAGGAAARAYTLEQVKPRGSSRVELRVDAMRRSLDLDDRQVEAILPIMRASEEERRQVMVPCQTDVDRVRADSDAKIRELLTAEQRAKYDEQSARWRGPSK